jgi:hypothetical protein
LPSWQGRSGPGRSLAPDILSGFPRFRAALASIDSRRWTKGRYDIGLK